MEAEGEVGEVVVIDVWEDKGDVFCERRRSMGTEASLRRRRLFFDFYYGGVV